MWRADRLPRHWAMMSWSRAASVVSSGGTPKWSRNALRQPVMGTKNSSASDTMHG